MGLALVGLVVVVEVVVVGLVRAPAAGSSAGLAPVVVVEVVVGVGQEPKILLLKLNQILI